MKNKLIKFILSFTDYDRLKKENEELKKDIYILVEKQGELDCFMVIGRWKMQYMIDGIYWFGNAGVECNEFQGIINMIGK